jgi:hypothetical protein
VLGDGTSGDGTATVQLTNAILAGTTASHSDFESDVFGGGSVVTSGDHNLIQKNSSLQGFAGQDTITGVAPLLGALGNYGGPTPTLPLLIGSPAINAGLILPDEEVTDQRGRPRFLDAGDGVLRQDLGACEVQNYVVTTTLDDSAAPTGTTTLRQAVHQANADGSGFVTFMPGLSGTLALTSAGDTPAGPSALTITGNIEIDGSVLASGELTISPDLTAPQMRLFYVAPAASLTLVDLTLSGGVAQNGSTGFGRGGAVFNSGTLTLLDSTLTGNSVIDHIGGFGLGGAVYNDGGQVSIINSTLAGNAVQGGKTTDGGIQVGLAQGGAVYSRNGKVTVVNSTLAGNSAAAGGALYVLADRTAGAPGNGTATVQLTNSILAGTAGSASDFESASRGGGSIMPSGSNDLIQTNASMVVLPHLWTSFGFALGPTIITGMDPMLGHLANNGGATQTMALLPGSPALDAGLDSAAPPADQRGAQRGPAGLNAGSHTDLGAFEDTSSYLVTTDGDGTGDGTLRAAVTWANASPNPRLATATANIVRFDTGGAFASGGTIALSTVGGTPRGPTALAITWNVEIDGPSSTGQGVTISANVQVAPMRLFYVAAGASLTLQDLTLTGGVAQGRVFAGQGGAVFNRGTLTLLASTLAGNQALGTAGTPAGGNGGYALGGAIYNVLGQVTITNSTLVANEAVGGDGGTGGSGGPGWGGALYNDAGQVTITNSTLADNVARGGAGGAGGTAGRSQGGAVYSSNGIITVLSATLAGNTADAGGALYVLADGTSDNGMATMNVVNSILASTSGSASDFQLALVNGGSIIANGAYDLVQNNPAVGSFPLNPTILTGVDPLLAPLADNGGPTLTMALIFGSPAIDVGVNNAAGEPSTDQRGQPRIVNGGSGPVVDLGAYELEPVPTTISVSVSNLSPNVGDAVTFTAQVADPATNRTPTGTVQFFIDGQPFGDPLPLVGGAAVSDPNSGLGLGAHVVTAKYTSDGSFVSVTGQLAGDFTVLAATGTTVSASAPSVEYGQAVTFTATVSSEVLSTGAPGGRVQFTDATTGLVLGNLPLVNGTAKVSPSGLGVGTHEVIATYLGNSPFVASVSTPQSVVVTVVPTSTATIAGVSAPSLLVGQGVTFSARVTSALGNPVGSVDFFDVTTGTDFGTVALDHGTASTPVITTLSPGQHKIVTTYLGEGIFAVSFDQTSATVLGGAANFTQTLSYHQNTFSVNLPAGSTTSVTIAGTQAFFLQRDLGLSLSADGLFQSFGGLGYNWLRGNGNAFGNHWYFLKPNGQLCAWDGTASTSGSTLVATLDPVYYVHPDLLYKPSQQSYDYILRQRFGLTFAGSYYQNYGGLNEKWLQGTTNVNGNPWYLITPGGQLYTWDGTPGQATGTLLANLDPLYWAQPNRLLNAQPNELNATITNNVLQVTTSTNFAGNAVVELNTSSPSANHQVFTLSFTDQAPVITITPSGPVTTTQGTPVSVTVNTTEADGDTVSVGAVSGHLGLVLQQSLGLRFQGSLFTNYGGQNEEWLKSKSGNWHFIKPDGSLWKWDGTANQASGTQVASLDQVYYYHPGLLYNPPAGDLAYALKQTLNLGNTGNLYLNYGGQNEKWLLGNDGWYFVKPDGTLWKWDGTLNQATGTLMATLDPDYYTNIQRVYDAKPNQVAVKLSGQTLTLTPATGLIGEFWILVRASNGTQTSYSYFPLTVTA